MNFYKVVLIIICKHLEIYTKTISRLRLGEYKPIFTSPSAPFSYPEPFLRAVRRGALAKSISELASDWLVLTPDIVFLPCFYGIRLWIWPEPLVASRVRRALGTRMLRLIFLNIYPHRAILYPGFSLYKENPGYEIAHRAAG